MTDTVKKDDQSPYQRRIIEIAVQNNAISPSFCLAKWKQVSINLTAGLTHSCYHPPEHKIPLNELEVDPSALHNTSFKKTERQKMLNGERPDGCSYCWKIEDSPGNHISDRQYHSLGLQAMQSDVYEEIVNNPDPANFNVIPSNVEVNFSGVCNFKCSYCSPHLSTEWKKEIDHYGPYPTTVPHNSVDYFKQIGLMPIPHKDYNPYVEAFWKWWPTLYTQLSLFRMTGGEPLMDVNTYRVLDYIIEHPKPDLLLALTTNLCPDKKLLNKFYSKLDKISENKSLREVIIYVSCDAHGQRAEYIRNGMDYDYLVDNADTFLKNYNIDSGVIYSVSFIATMTLMSITSLRDFIDNTVIGLRKKHNIDSAKRYRQRVFLDTPIIHSPAWQSVQILPVRYREILRADIEYFKARVIFEHDSMDAHAYAQLRDFEVAKLERVLSWMEQGDNLSPEKLKRDRADFYKFFLEHDIRRGTNFLETFPEMEDFWELCKEAACQ